ncbi:MAG: hypothetical protein Q8M66_06805, partial [Actinomycetota bacterium]|nr:hypothetical protein [Actinomycetota bacterium]
KGATTVKKTLFVAVLTVALVLSFAAAAFAASGVPNRSSAYLGTDTSEASRDVSGGGSKAAYVTWTKAVTDMTNAGVAADLRSTPHAGYTTTTIKCQVCHSVHKAVYTGSNLLMSSAGGCVVCHGATSAVGSNVKVSADGLAADQGGFANEDQRHGKADSCASYECHATSPHGVGVSSYAVAASALLSEAVDPLIEAALASGVSNAVETATINDDWTAEMHIDFIEVDVLQPAWDADVITAITAPVTVDEKALGRALVTGYTCANNGCHINGNFNGMSSDSYLGAWRITVGGVELVNSSTETTLGVNNLRDQPIKGHTLFSAAGTTAYAASATCKACHDQTDVRRSGAKAFPHSNAVWAVADAAGTGNNVSGAFTDYGYVKLYNSAAWFNVAPSVDQTFTVTNGRNVPATTPTFGQALTVGMDGACLKCHRAGAEGAEVGVGIGY